MLGQPRSYEEPGPQQPKPWGPVCRVVPRLCLRLEDLQRQALAPTWTQGWGREHGGGLQNSHLWVSSHCCVTPCPPESRDLGLLASMAPGYLPC